MATTEKNTGNVIFAKRQKYYIDPDTGNHVNIGTSVNNNPYANPLGDNIGPVNDANVSGISCPVPKAFTLHFIGATSNGTSNICTAPTKTIYQSSNNFSLGDDIYADESLSTYASTGWYAKVDNSSVQYGYWDNVPGQGLISQGFGSCPVNLTIPKP